MAFQYTVSVKKNGTDCKQLLFVDETGNYSTTNPGGWGLFNKAERQDVEESTVDITSPDNTTTTVDLYPLPYEFPQIKPSISFFSFPIGSITLKITELFIIILGLFLLIVYRHRANINRILKKTEPKVYLLQKRP
jgi:hypothetical protein